jgi:hypothetical protein
MSSVESLAEMFPYAANPLPEHTHLHACIHTLSHHSCIHSFRHSFIPVNMHIHTNEKIYMNIFTFMKHAFT